MGFLLRSLAIFIVATKRLLSQRGLALAIVLGLVASVALVMSIPLYTDAVYYRILKEELEQTDPNATVQRPPFAFMFRYIGSTYGAAEWQDIEAVDSYLSGPAADTLGLPHQQTVRYFKTDNFRLFPADQVAYADVRDPLEWVNFGFANDFENHITILEGGLPAVAESALDSTIEVLVSDVLAHELGLQIGEEFVTFRRTRTESGNTKTVQIPIRIAGVWTATDPNEEYWFYSQVSLKTVLFIPEASFQLRVAPALDDEVYLALWYLIMDGSDIHANDVERLLGRIQAVKQQAANLRSDTRLDISPEDALGRYWRSSRLLTVLLYAFSIPIIGLILAFIGLVVGLAVGRQRNEIAVLRSRGATVSQVVGIAGLEALVLGVTALALGLPISQWIAQAIGATRSFLDFTVESSLRIGLTVDTLRFGFIAVAVTMTAQVLPTIGAARHTIVTYKQEQARTMRRPWWQRAWLDIILLIPAGYGAYLLREQGSIVLPGATGTLGSNPFQNPLLFLVPALGTLALTLVLLRILPLVISAIAWLVSKTNGVGMLLATRQLSRSPGLYTAPLILLILTLSLSVFTTSLAQTLDNHLYDQIHYKNGGDMHLVELGATNTTGSSISPTGTDGESTSTDADSVLQEPTWVFVPVSEHLRVPEIQAATRVGRYNARIQLQGRWQDSLFLGVDRLDFPQVSFWRQDFSASSLGSLMNALALSQDGVLLPRSFMREQAIRVGDTIQVQVAKYGQQATMTMQVMGDFNHFPTWYEEADGPLLVGNLDYLFEQAGGMIPYNVWARAQPGTDYAQMVRDLRQYDITVLDWKSSRLQIAQQQRLPERQGLFGVLSVGFLAAALLTVLGFLLYALFSFRRRFIELGTLRAIGLSPGQMTTFLAWELAFLILVGLSMGTALGAFMSQLFIPYLQVGNDAASLTPPFLVEIAWPAIIRVYILFGMLFVVALGILATLLLRMKIFQAIKLGETV